MVLTPEEIVNKQFQTTKFREGYDQDEVDDFLDEIVVELQRLNDDNEKLRIRIQELKKFEKTSISKHNLTNDSNKLSDNILDKNSDILNSENVASMNLNKNENENINNLNIESNPHNIKGSNNINESSISSSFNTTESATGVLAMAQKLHDEYVKAGIEQREKIITEAQMEATDLMKDAQEKSRQTIGVLEQKKSSLERRVEQLRNFEKDYRSRLKAYIEGQLRDLEARGSMTSIEIANS